MAKVRDEKDLVEMFESQFTRSEDKFSTVKKHWKEDNDFSLGEQWDAGSRNNRSILGQERPCLTINKIDPLVHRIVNSAKQKKLEAIVKPVDDTSDPDTAYILAGLVRNCEYVSNAIRAYMWAYECAIRAGVGYFRIVNDYEDDNSNDQTVRVKRIRNPLCVSFDPDSEDQNGADSTVCVISEEISKYAADELCKDVDYDSAQIIPARSIWMPSDGEIKHGEIYWEEREQDTLYKLSDGSYVRESEIHKDISGTLKQSGHVVSERKIQKKTVRYGELCGGKVIQNLETNSKYIPVVRLIGREGYINGKLDLRGITRNSMDPNRMYNVMSSLLVERIGLAPRAPYIGAAGQFEGYENDWLNANNVNLPKLEYNPITIGGNLAPPPQRNDASSGDPTIERYMMLSDKDIKDTSALGDAFMGNKSNEVSGAGIKARASQSDLSTFDFEDNAADSIEHSARIQIDMFQRIMSDRQVIRILGDDSQQKVINLNAFQGKDGSTKKIDLGVGKFDTEISVASGDKTRRETAIEQLSFVLQTNPQAANLIMDIFVGNLDIKDADKIAKRFKSMVPPQALAAEEQGEKDNPELDAYEQHATQIITQLKAQLQEAIAKEQDAEQKLKNRDGELAIKDKEVHLKSREVDIKELATMAEIKQKKIDSANKATFDKEGSSENKKEKGKEEPSEHDDSTQIQLITRKLQGLEHELEMITQVLERLHETAQGGPTQSPAASTKGNGLPPAEADTNVGASND